jgi:hypothetical protein
VSVETQFRIVINHKRPANSSGRYPWQCTLCGAAVANVDIHAQWHELTNNIRYGTTIRSIDGELLVDFQ